jgi:beta-lactamase superfamily II metal-dependent hydrolase
VLFSGDIEEGAARNLLLSEPGQLPSTILKVPHHGGSLGEAGAGFIENVSPRIAVVSSGDREINSDILSALKKLKAQIYQTSKDGAIFLTN